MAEKPMSIFEEEFRKKEQRFSKIEEHFEELQDLFETFGYEIQLYSHMAIGIRPEDPTQYVRVVGQELNLEVNIGAKQCGVTDAIKVHYDLENAIGLIQRAEMIINRNPNSPFLRRDK